jgi:hypothetical protein
VRKENLQVLIDKIKAQIGFLDNFDAHPRWEIYSSPISSNRNPIPRVFKEIEKIGRGFPWKGTDAGRGE